MPRWNPIPSAVCRDQTTETEPRPREILKTNGYVFKRTVGKTNRGTDETRYIPKICRAMPLYPKTYGLSCDQQNCPHCHPDPDIDAKPRGPQHRSKDQWRGEDRGYFYLVYSYPMPGACVIGKRGCRPEKMIQIRPKNSDNISKDETRRRAARTEEATKEKENDESNKHDKSQRLSKWETSPSRPIDEGRELAISEDRLLPTDESKAEDRNIQLAVLASLGLLDDYEAEDADVTLDSLPWDEGAYTVKYKSGKKRQSNTRDGHVASETPSLGDFRDWELVPGSPSEDSVSWVLLDE